MKLGIYLGSFSPFHAGHASVYLAAKNLFDKVILGIGQNPKKQTPDLNAHAKEVREQAQEFLLAHAIQEPVETFSYTHVEDLNTLLQVIKNNADLEYFFIRGLRTGEDFDCDLALFDYVDHDKVVYIPANPFRRAISSTRIREGEINIYGDLIT